MHKFLFLLFAVFVSIVSASHAGDGIPDNCETSATPNLFLRYEPQNRRLVLIDWTTGAEVQVITSDLMTTRIMGWSPDCRYLAVAVGESESMDTIVFDTANHVKVGFVADARQAPHPITWGPNNYLMVETRTGAILWNVPANTQIRLTDSFDPFTARNFSRIRWDIANGQVIVNLAVGGREVYDLHTGQKLELAANSNNSEERNYFGAQPVTNTITLGGKSYTCRRSYYGQEYTVGGIETRFDYPSQTLSLVLYPYQTGARFEAVEMIEDGLNASWYRDRGWSSDCRYVAASLGIEGQNASNTVVWDVVKKRRVGMFEDARIIVHPIRWSPINSSLIIETRDGAYLWHLPSNTRTLLTKDVQTSLAGQTSIQTFTKIRWLENRLYTIEIDEPELVKVYDNQTGTLLETLPAASFPAEPSTTPVPAAQFVGVPGTGTPVDAESGYSNNWWRYRRSRCADATLAYYRDDTRQIILRDVSTGDERALVQGINQTDSLTFSPNCRYLTAEVSLASNEPVTYDTSPVDDTVFYDKSENFLIWDVETGEQVAQLPHLFRYQTYAYVRWSPDGGYALLRLTSGHYVIELATRRIVFLTFQETGGSYYYNRPASHTWLQTYWDFERGQVLIGGWNAVHAFDLVTGKESGRFTASTDAGCSWFSGCVFSLSPDRKTLFIESGNAVGIWNLNTYEHHQIDVDPSGSSYPGQFALSPDGRYFVIARSMVRVWDLTNLPEEFRDRDPVYRYAGPFAYVRQMRFIDNTTVELGTRRDGTYHLDVTTGQMSRVD
jgi:WD40 repeat protein